VHAAVYRRMVHHFAGGRPLAVTIRTSIDAPPGSGLGSSSGLVVALVEAFRAVLDLPLDPYEIAHLAFEIERIDLALSGGKQDHYAAAFGGMNFIEFLKDGRVVVNPLRIPPSTLNELEASLITCFSGVSRRSDEIIEQQKLGMVQKSAKAIDNLHRLKDDAMEMKQALLRANIPEMARILNRSWNAKKETAVGISTDHIDEIYQFAFDNGALGGKVSGAGGGGFIMLIVAPERRVDLLRALNDRGVHSSAVQFTDTGVESWTAPTMKS
jgi:D-glycero-alpha-D-manno-heptose-7-phosphate kinase